VSKIGLGLLVELHDDASFLDSNGQQQNVLMSTHGMFPRPFTDLTASSSSSEIAPSASVAMRTVSLRVPIHTDWDTDAFCLVVKHSVLRYGATAWAQLTHAMDPPTTIDTILIASLFVKCIEQPEVGTNRNVSML
jgi:hypothetical protein